jgi:hypothetical protein
MSMDEPKNNYEALVLALRLALTAKEDDPRKDECVAMAEEFAQNFSEIEVARAKKEAAILAEMDLS